MKSRTSVPLRIKATSVADVLGVLALAIYGFITYSVLPVVNVIAMAIALYAASSIVVEAGLKQLPAVFTVSVLSTIIADLCFAFLQPFIAICIFFSVLLVAIRYFLAEDHDSGWFGAFFVELIGLIFLLPIEIILVIIRLFLF